MICSKRMLRSCACLMTVGLASLLVAERTEAANGSVVYGYDALGRLTSAYYDTGVCITYGYDANGNRTSEKILVVASGSTGIWGCFTWNNGKWGP